MSGNDNELVSPFSYQIKILGYEKSRDKEGHDIMIKGFIQHLARKKDNNNMYMHQMLRALGYVKQRLVYI